MVHHLVRSAVLEISLLIGFGFIAQAKRALSWLANCGKEISLVLIALL